MFLPYEQAIFTFGLANENARDARHLYGENQSYDIRPSNIHRRIAEIGTFERNTNDVVKSRIVTIPQIEYPILNEKVNQSNCLAYST